MAQGTGKYKEGKKANRFITLLKRDRGHYFKGYELTTPFLSSKAKDGISLQHGE